MRVGAAGQRQKGLDSVYCCLYCQPTAVALLPPLPARVKPSVHGHLSSGVVLQRRWELESFWGVSPPALLLLLVYFGIDQARASRTVLTLLLVPHTCKHNAERRGCELSLTSEWAPLLTAARVRCITQFCSSQGCYKILNVV